MAERLSGNAPPAPPISEGPRTSFAQAKYDLAYPPGIEGHYWTLARNWIIERQVRSAGLVCPRVLEIGCGKGIVVDHLRRRGHDCRGIEMAPTRPLAAAGDFIITGLDPLEAPQEIRESAELLLLLDVIEHVPDPVRFLSDVLRRFPNAAGLIVTAPAREELWSNYDEFYGHERRYDAGALDRVLGSAGWEVRDTRYFFRLLYPPARALARLGLRRSVEIRAPGPWGRILHRILAGLLFLDHLLLPRSLPGTSLIARACRGRR